MKIKDQENRDDDEERLSGARLNVRVKIEMKERSEKT